MRENALLSRKALAHKVGVTERTVGRWELGTTAPDIDVRSELASIYGVSIAELNAAIAGAVPNGYHSVTNDLGLLVGLEQSATELRWWELAAVPALLQTEAYATAVESAATTPAGPDEIAHTVSFRLRRQQVLTRQPYPLRLSALLDASVLLRTTGDADVMAEQIDHLRAMNRRPNVSVRVVPLDGRIHAARGAFMLLTAPGGDVPYVVVSETISDVSYQGSATDVSTHLAAWDHLWELADDLENVEL